VTGLSHLEEDRVSESYYNDSDPGAVVGPPVDNANGSTSDATRGARTGLTSSIIAFNTKDALTNEPLVDPVLGSDGLIHDRWSLLDTDNALARSITMCVKGLTSCSIPSVSAHKLVLSSVSAMLYNFGTLYMLLRRIRGRSAIGNGLPIGM
jgi:hypothetical protein